MLAPLSGQSSLSTPTRANRRRRQFGGQAGVAMDVPAWANSVNVHLLPRGNGYISANAPDGLSAGGNQRGNSAVDLQLSRTNAAHVASGANAFLTGFGSTASGAQASALGLSCTASGAQAFAAGSTAFATNASDVAIGRTVTASGGDSTCLGAGGTASGVSTRCLAHDGVIAGSYAFGTGFKTATTLYGEHAHSAGFFAAVGDAQWSILTARNSTAANTTPVNLFLDGTSARLVLPANTVWAFEVRIVGATVVATGAFAKFKRSGIISRGATAASTVIATVDTEGTDRGSNGNTPPAGWAVAITADATNGALDIQCTGYATAAVRWVAEIRLCVVSNP